MATVRASWTENQSVRAAAAVAAVSSAEHDIDLMTPGADRAKVQVDIATGLASSVTVEVFDAVDGGSVFDTEAAQAYSVTSDSRRTLYLDGPRHRIRLTNDDGSHPTGNVAIVMAYRVWSSA